ncbi:MAG: thermonuclease family protein [Rhodospirillales bacterium]|nr:thermonuclease family protein [Alphaproteobacteria bacterium]MCB9987455.1 thermonuclease family protein [Rhodospirillales bacterium]USO07566.1 MAG: thermonuclease family protein [Rhodospirillales bacterium]
MSTFSNAFALAAGIGALLGLYGCTEKRPATPHTATSRAELKQMRGKTLHGRAVVYDGDTLRLFTAFPQKPLRVRIWGIDAPELKQRCGAVACGEIARQRMNAIIADQPVSCQVKDVDRYKRLVAQCFAQSVDIGRALVQAGLAVDYAQFSHGAYASDEITARTNGAGVWGMANFEEPTHWRICNLPQRGRARPATCDLP